MTSKLVPNEQPHIIRAEILTQWDKSRREGKFPRLETDSHWGFIKARLSAFRSVDEWLTIFEVLVYWNGFGDLINQVYGFGNKLDKVGFNPQSGPTDSNLVESDTLRIPAPPSVAVDDDWWCSDPYHIKVMLGKNIQELCFTPADYANANINLERALSGDKVLDRILHVLRMLAHYLTPEQIFYSEQYLLRMIGRPLNMPLFIQTYEWCHPGLTFDRPSMSPCLYSLANALAYNQFHLFHCVPELANTHWSKWPFFLPQ